MKNFVRKANIYVFSLIHILLYSSFYKHSFPHENVGKEQLKIFIFVHKYDIYKIFAMENKNFKTGMTTFIFLAILFYLTPKACPEVPVIQ